MPDYNKPNMSFLVTFFLLTIVSIVNSKSPNEGTVEDYDLYSGKINIVFQENLFQLQSNLSATATLRTQKMAVVQKWLLVRGWSLKFLSILKSWESCWPL
jgi:hypothetical protein